MGEHILKKRLEDKLTQKALATRIGVDPITVMNWELGHTKTIPAVSMRRVIDYLGYNPEPRSERIGDQLRWKRRALGWTTTEAARNNSVDPATWQAWERLDRWPAYPRFREFLREFLDMTKEQLISRTRQVRLPCTQNAQSA